MKKFTVLLVIALVAAAGVLAFIYYFGSRDATALADFSTAYDNYDKAITDYSRIVLASNPVSAAVSDELEQNAAAALGVLNTKASARISSLTRHDAEIMSTTLQIAALAAQELDALRTYQKAAAAKNVDLSRLAKVFGDLASQRGAAYAHFLSFAGQ